MLKTMTCRRPAAAAGLPGAKRRDTTGRQAPLRTATATRRQAKTAARFGSMLGFPGAIRGHRTPGRRLVAT
jgi:hypothetical protein